MGEKVKDIAAERDRMLKTIIEAFDAARTAGLLSLPIPGNDASTSVAEIMTAAGVKIKEMRKCIPTWTLKQPPWGVWAYSHTDGLFCITGLTKAGYHVVKEVNDFVQGRLGTSMTYICQFHGPFCYPMPDPTKGYE